MSTPFTRFAAVLLLVAQVQAAEITTDWPSYRGGNGQFSETSGVKLIGDMTQAKLLWESEEKTIGFGKTDSGYGKSMAHFGELMPAGIASPIVAGDLVIQFYAQPTGEVIDETSKASLTPENWEKYKHKARVDADDVVIAIDAATGKTRWKRVFANAGRNPGSGKRNLSGMTPVAADGAPSFAGGTTARQGKVFAMGTCGALYALDLKSGETLWQLPNWPELQAAKETALAKRGPAGAACPTGWLTMVDGVLIVPVTTYCSPRGVGLARGIDPATGKTLWEVKVNPNTLAPGLVNGKACLVAPHIALEAKTGQVLWQDKQQPGYYRPPVFGQKFLIGFEPHTNSVALLQAKEGNTNKGAGAYGTLAAYRVDKKGVTRQWALPPQYSQWMQPDNGGFPCVAARDGLIYHLAECYQAPGSAEIQARLVVIREADGTILASQPIKGGLFYLWGDRAIVVTDIFHRPRGANPEIWQMYNADPAKLGPLGKGWHVNGNPPAHLATGGYELPVLEAFADGIAFFRVAGGIRAYDLRARASTWRAFRLLGPAPGFAQAQNYVGVEAEIENGKVMLLAMTQPERNFERVGRSSVLTAVPAQVTPLVAGRWTGEVDMALVGLAGQRWQFELDLSGANPAGTYRGMIAALPKTTAVTGAADASEQPLTNGVRRLFIGLKQAVPHNPADAADKRRDLNLIVDRSAAGEMVSWARARLLNTATHDVQLDRFQATETQMTVSGIVLLHADQYVEPSSQRSGNVAMAVNISLQRDGETWKGTYTGQYGVEWSVTGAIGPAAEGVP